MALAGTAGAGDRPLSPRQAAARIGEEVVVRGHVDRVVCSSRSCLLSFEPGFRGLVVAIPAGLRAELPSPREAFEGRSVEVRGVVEARSGRPRLVLGEASDIRRLALSVGVLESRTIERPGGLDRSRAAAASQPVAAASESARRSRLGATIRALEGEENPRSGAAPAGLEALARRVAAIEERLAESMPAAPGLLPLADGAAGTPGREGGVAALRQALADLEREVAALAEDVGELGDRLEAVEQALAGRAEQEADVPRLPPYVVPAFQPPSLNRVRRGWSAERVLRTLGPPERVVRAAGGSSVWDYGDGRSVTVDGRGRVVSAAGF